MSLNPYTPNENGPGGLGYQSVVLLPDDGDTWLAEEFTPYMEQEADNIAYLAASRAVAWRGAQAWSGSNGPYHMVWNYATVGPSARQWLTLGFNGGGSSTWTLFQVTGDDDAPTPVCTAVAGSPVPTGLCVDGSGNVYAANIDTVGGNVNVWEYTPGTGVFGSATATSVPSVTDVRLAIGTGAAVIVAAGSSASGDAFLATHGVGGVANLFVITGLVVQSWLLRSNLATVLAIPLQSGVPSIYTDSATGGVTWTATLGSSVFASGDVPVDLTWSEIKQQWLLVTRTTTPTWNIFTSPDGVTWTLVKALSNTAIAAVSWAGSFWFAATYNGTTFVSQVIWSPDGVTWFPSQAYLFPGAAGPPVMGGSVAGAAIVAQPTGGSDLVYKFQIPCAPTDVEMT